MTRSMLRHGLLVLAGLVGLLSLIVVALPFVISTDWLRSELSRQVETRAGYKLALGSDFSVSGLPSLKMATGEVRLEAVDPEAPLSGITARGLDVGLDAMALLSGRAVFDEITLREPVFNLVAGGGQAETVADDGETGEPLDLPALLDQAERLEIARFSVENGKVNLVSAEGTTTVDVETLEIGLPSISRSSTFAGQVSTGGRDIIFSGTLETPRALASGEAAAISATISVPGMTSGEVALNAMAELAATSIAISDATLVGEGLDLSGSLSAVWAGFVPRLAGEVNGTLLRLPAAADETPEAAGSPDVSDIQELDLSVFGTADSNISVSIDRIEAGNYVIAPAVGRVRTSGGLFDLTADMVGFAGGRIVGNVAVDPAGGGAEVVGRVEVDGLDMVEVAKFAALPYAVTGQAGASIDFATAGRTVGQLRQRLNAAGNVFLSQAKVSGLNLSSMVGDPAADTLEGVGIVAEFASLSSPIGLRGGATWRGERFDITGTVDAKAFIAGNPAGVAARVAGARGAIGYDGVAAPGGNLDGAFSVETASLRQLMAWMNRPLPPGNGLERFAFSGALSLRPDSVAFDNATVVVDETSGRGNGKVSFGAVPNVDATLALDVLDLNPYLSDAGSAGAGGAGGGGSGWSEAPIDLSALRGVNANLRLTTFLLAYRKLEAGPVDIAITINDGALTANLSRMALYGGEGIGLVEMTERDGVPSLDLQFDLAGLQGGPFLAALADFDRIDGQLAVAMDLSTSGSSQRQMAAAVDGKASIRFFDGSIRGINLASMMQTLSTETLLGWQSGGEGVTNFSELSATFDVVDGTATNNDLTLIGPLVEVAGQGTVDLPGQTLDFRVDPKLVASIEGQGRLDQPAGFGVPIRVTGPWSRPRIYPDIAGILENPAAAYQQLRGLGGGIFQSLGLPSDVGAPVTILQDNIQDATGVNVGDIIQDGRIDGDAARGAAVDALGRLLGNDGTPEPGAPQPVAPAPAPDAGNAADPGAPISLDPNAVPAPESDPAAAEAPQEPAGLNDAARNVLRNILGGN